MRTRPKVLVIYTGGTIGMIKDARSGTLAPMNFEHLSAQIPELAQLSAEIAAVSIRKPIDSSDMGLKEWQELAELIAANYESHDGFVILHGSDTMAYTASALSFMCQNLGKPVILTGSQLPIGVVRTDGKENFITAIEIASHYERGAPVVPEVCIYFEYQLYRGNRTYKFNAEHFEAFRSPNFPQLARAGVAIAYRHDLIRKPEEGPFSINTRLGSEVAVLTLFPGISPAVVETALNLSNIKVLILKTFGSGNALTAKWFLQALRAAVASGKILINVSQCRAGGVHQGRYLTSQSLQEIGVISAGDMMLEAALAKTMHLLGQGIDRYTFKERFVTNLRGEVTPLPAAVSA